MNQLLSEDQKLANKGITIPFELFCNTYAHPLHRICDAVFAKKISDQDAIQLASVLITHGSRVDGNRETSQEDPPILAAASLHAELLGIYLIEKGADPNVIGSDGASALHWAAFCGKDKLVSKLISSGADIDLKDSEHKSTPIQWAIHCIISGDLGNKGNQIDCIRLLVAAGSDVGQLDHQTKDFLSNHL